MHRVSDIPHLGLSFRRTFRVLVAVGVGQKGSSHAFRMPAE